MSIHERGNLWVQVAENEDGTVTVAFRNVRRGGWFGWEEYPSREAALARYHLTEANRLGEAAAARLV